MYKLIISGNAQTEIEEIARTHLELVGPNAASNIVDRIYQAISRLEQFPHSGHVISERSMREKGYRYVLAGKYLCVYRLLENAVVIYHVVHGSTDYPKLFADAIDFQ